MAFSNIYNAITDVPGIKVGHATDMTALTGCTVVLCEEGAAAGVDVRGYAPGTRETDALNPINTGEKVHGVLLTGGSAFGLDAAGGVMQYLEEKGYGLPIGFMKVPIVPAAVIFDLLVGDGNVRPDKRMGYLACLNADAGKVKEGNVGAGTGATVGKILGMQMCMKSGLGTASICITARGNVVVGAIVVVNALGDVVDPDTGSVIAGARDIKTGNFINAVKRMTSTKTKLDNDVINTTIGVVATNARLDKVSATRIARMSHDGLARVIRPVHTTYDGDTLFVLSTGDAAADLNVVGTAAVEVLIQAVIRAVRAAKNADGIPGLAGE
jgi:L-aminopeptidase/D-esterase-like protein